MIRTWRWRYLFVGLELLVAAACFFTGWSWFSNHQEAQSLKISRGPSAASPAAPAAREAVLGLPLASPAPGGVGHRVSQAHRSAGDLPSASLLDRINRDDFDLYRRQWQVVQLFIDGVRRYLEQRVVPELLVR